jgi:shikimate dehydrogenase
MRRACVIGWPVEHSRSPLIHRYWLEQYGIDGAYKKEAVESKDLPEFLGSLAARGYAGANVTLPHKEAALRLAAIADEAARAIGAANTLWLDEAGRLNAGNTDAYGFITNLNAEAPGWNDARRPVMVLGAGGAARAILHGLLAEGASRILLANRTRDRAETLARDFGPAVIVVDWRERARALGCGSRNATSLGMTSRDLSTNPRGRLTPCRQSSSINPLKADFSAALLSNQAVDRLNVLHGRSHRALVRGPTAVTSDGPMSQLLRELMIMVIGLAGGIG